MALDAFHVAVPNLVRLRDALEHFDEAKPVPRSPAAVLANLLDSADPERSALAEAVESATQAGSVRTHAELLADAAELATAGRTARWLDELVNDGHLTGRQRVLSDVRFAHDADTRHDDGAVTGSHGIVVMAPGCAC